MPRSRWGGVGCIASAAACALYQHRDASFPTEILGEVKRQNPPCAHWAGDLVDWELWGFQNTSFRKNGRVSKYNWSVAKYNREVSKYQFQNATVQFHNTTV